MSFLAELDLARTSRGARDWLSGDRDLARRGREMARLGRDARDWLNRDERRRVIGLVVFSVAISIAMSLLATSLAGFVTRRRAAAPGAELEAAGAAAGDAAGDAPGEAAELAEPALATEAGVPVMEAVAVVPGEALPVEA
jgi:hypothetical protein